MCTDLVPPLLGVTPLSYICMEETWHKVACFCCTNPFLQLFHLLHIPIPSLASPSHCWIPSPSVPRCPNVPLVSIHMRVLSGLLLISIQSTQPGKPLVFKYVWSSSILYTSLPSPFPQGLNVYSGSDRS